MPKLTDTQAILLTHAANRDDGMLLPKPDTITAPADRVAKAIATLVSLGFAVEVAVTQAAETIRSDDDKCVGAVITNAGRAAVGIAEDDSPIIALIPLAAAAPKRETKVGAVLAMLQRDEGATLVELIAATNWLPHTTRAALTGIRKKGNAVEKTKRGDDTCYRIVAIA